MSQKDSKIFSGESQSDKCEPIWLISGPPFDQRDYMISPSESAVVINNDQNLAVEEKKKLSPCDIKIDSKYLIDSQRALKKLVDLIRDGCAPHFPHRLKNLIYKFIQGTPLGFFVEDLAAVTEVVQYFARNQNVVPEFKTFVSIFISVAKNPPKMGRTSDMLHSKKAFAEYFTLFGELLATFENESFQLDILEALDWLITRRTLVDVMCVKISFCHEAMENSQLPYVLTTLMETIPSNLYVHYLELAIQILSVSLKSGCVMVLNNMLDYVLLRLDSSFVNDGNNFSEDNVSSFEKIHNLCEHYKLLDKSSFLIWSLLSVIKNFEINVSCPGVSALRSLRMVFQEETKKKTMKAIHTRNNLAGLIVKLYVIFGEKLPMVQTGLAEDIALLSVATEIGTKGTWAADIKFGTQKEDYIFKKLMLLCCCLLSKNMGSVKSLKFHKVIKGILHLINPKTSVPWIPSQFITLLFIALRSLTEIVPVLPEEFVASKGNMRLLSAMQWFMEEHFDRDPLLETLRTFSSVITCENNKCIVEDVKAQNGVKSILELCFYLLDVTFMKIEHQEKLSRVFVVLETLFKNDRELQIKFKESCVLVSIKILERTLADLKNDSKWNPKLFVSFGGFLWEAVAWCQVSLKLFIEQCGVFLLLDFIELVDSFPVQMLFLGILVDMTDEGETIAHLLTWRGKNGYGILNMMIDIWRKEEFFTKVQRTKEGLIQDVEKPLMTEEQWYLTYQHKETFCHSPSISEMICSARPKINALYQFLQQRYFTLTQIGELSYNLQLKVVKPLYQVYIPLIEHFVALKMGEIWSEILRDLNNCGIILSSFDGELVYTLIDEKNKWASRIKTLQEEIISINSGGDAKQEDKLYNFLRSCRMSSALEALSELDYLARTSFKQFQKQRKRKQTNDVENSLKTMPFYGDDNLHRTYVQKTNVTTFCGDYVWINSEKEVVEREDVFLVSPQSSTEKIPDCSGEF